MDSTASQGASSESKESTVESDTEMAVFPIVMAPHKPEHGTELKLLDGGSDIHLESDPSYFTKITPVTGDPDIKGIVKIGPSLKPLGIGTVAYTTLLDGN